MMREEVEERQVGISMLRPGKYQCQDHHALGHGTR